MHIVIGYLCGNRRRGLLFLRLITRTHALSMRLGGLCRGSHIAVKEGIYLLKDVFCAPERKVAICCTRYLKLPYRAREIAAIAWVIFCALSPYKFTRPTGQVLQHTQMRVLQHRLAFESTNTLTRYIHHMINKCFRSSSPFFYGSNRISPLLL